MKKNLLCACCLAATVVGGSTYAITTELTPYVGADLRLERVRFKESDAYFKKHAYEGNVYGGIEFHKNFALELGYEHGQRTKRKVDLGAGGSFLGVNGMTGKQKLELKSRAIHVDLIGIYHYADKIDLIGSVGTAWMNTAGYVTDEASNVLDQLSGKTKAILEIGVGLKYKINDNIGIKILGQWQNKSTLSELSCSTANYKAKMKDSFKLNLGVLFYI